MYQTAQLLELIRILIVDKITARPEMTKVIAHGSNLDIDTDAERLTSRDFPCRNGIVIKTPADNAGTVYVGLIDVTAGTVESTDGFPLAGEDSFEIEIENVNLIYVIASQVNQQAFWAAS